MAQVMDDLEFLLPSELLTDDDLLTDFAFGFRNSCGLISDLSSPVESVTGTTETGSNEDDFVSELTRKLTHSSLRDSNLSYGDSAKSLKLSGSPQSTLCGFKPGSRGSPNPDSRVCSPPYAKDALSWDLLYAAAEEVARMRMVEETAAFYSKKLFAPVHKPSPVTIPQQKPNPASGFYPNQSQAQTHLFYQQLQAVKFEQMKQHQMMNNGVLGPGNMEYQLQHGRWNGGEGRVYGLSMSAWPTLHQYHQQTGSGTKLVCVGETGPKKERVGTGVFMPRRFSSTPTETRKKPDAVLKHSNEVMLAHERRNHRPQPLMNQEFSLPQEWTY